MKRLVIPALFLLFLPGNLLPQIRTLDRSLHWGHSVPAPTPSEPDNQRLLFFDRASYDETENFLPYYTELLDWSGFPYPEEIRISDAKYEDFSAGETEQVKLPASIPENAMVSYSIQQVRKQNVLVIRILPLRKNPFTGRTEKLVSFRLSVYGSGQGPSARIGKKSMMYANHSVLASGRWIRIKIPADGIYQLSYAQLTALGFSNPASVRVFGQGGAMLPYENDQPRLDDLPENAVFFEKGADGVFNQGDYLLFYGKGPGTWVYDSVNQEFTHNPHLYAESSVYFLTDLPGTGKQVQTLPSTTLPATQIVTRFQDYRVHELDQENLIKSGRRWFEPMVPYTPRDLSFSFPNLDPAGTARVSALLVARSPANSSFTVSANGTEIFSMPVGSVNTGSYVSDYARDAGGTGTFPASGNEIDIRLQYNNQGVPSAECWIDWVRVNAFRRLVMTGSQMKFRDPSSAGPGEVPEFRISNAPSDLSIWDITDPLQPSAIGTSLNGGTLSFRLETDALREFIAFRKTGFLQPEIEDEVLPNQDLHGTGPVDLVIVSHPDFLSEALRLADHRRVHDGLRVVVVTPEQVYNEFSSGTPDVSAIRNFMKMLYDRAGSPDDLPGYLLLVGDGSYDNLSQAQNNTNFILTYQSLNSFGPTRSYVTDDFFGLLDDDEGNADGLIDIGIGRLPVTSAAEARDVVDKIIRYDMESQPDDWKNQLCFIGDDEDYNIHMRDADILANFIDTTYTAFNINKIYLDAYPQVSTPNGQRYPDVNEAINRQMERGALIMNYTGHGNERGLAHEAILGKSDIESWDNEGRLPLFITATCEFSRFDDVERTLAGEFSKKTSAGELVLLNETGGVVALLTTTRLVYSSPNFVLNRNFYTFVFERDNQGRYYRLGDALRLTKNISGASINKRNFTLLGDPSMTLAFPKLQVITESINGQAAGPGNDTLKALSTVQISGHIADLSGNILPDFEGLLYPTVYDKKREVQTLDNDGFGPMDFYVRNNILYKGKASITNGNFQFTFIVPKDIAYEVGPGKVSYYAYGSGQDARGAYTEALVGGFSSISQNDTEGPLLRLFMNDESFVNGGITNDSPLFLAFVSDSNGVNTVGNGIGHDITAELDGDNQNLIVLNDYYESDLDSYRSGSIRYRLSDLEPGDHRIRLKVWDVYNNSGTGELDFIVENDARLALDHVLNYPNPFTTHTSFFFEHNQPNTQMDVMIQIFTVSGKLVKTLHANLLAEGYRVGPLEWDGLDEFGNTIGRGVYVYRVKVRTSEGKYAEKFEKLVILR